MAGPIYLHDSEAVSIGSSISSGCVGIGTTNGSHVLQVQGTAQIEGGVLTLDGSNPATYDSTPTLSSDNQIPHKGYVDNQVTSGSGWTDDGTTVRLSTSSDKIGIGTTSADNSVRIEGNISAGAALKIKKVDCDNGLEVISESTSGNAFEVACKIGGSYINQFHVEPGAGDVVFSPDFDAATQILCGSLTVGGTKNFRIQHPTDSKKYLIHSCVEGPDCSVFYRGENSLKNGIANVRLPSYFEKLTKKESRTILLTCIDDWSPLCIKSAIKKGRFKVELTDGKGNKNQKFHWLVMATRNDPDLESSKLIDTNRCLIVEKVKSRAEIGKEKRYYIRKRQKEKARKQKAIS